MLNLPEELTVIPETGLTANNYLLEFSCRAYLIEASANPDAILPLIGNKKLGKIFLTHGHFDHIGRLDEWRVRSGAPAAIHAAETRYLTDINYNGSAAFGHPATYNPIDEFLSDSQTIELTEQDKLTVWHTPGHTPGSVCFLWEKAGQAIALFTGDTIIGNSIGRTDFPGGNIQDMRQTLIDLLPRLQALPPALPVLCGHGPVVARAWLWRCDGWLTDFADG